MRLISLIQSSLSDDLLSPTWRRLRTRHPLSGHCYVAAETLFHLLGGAGSGWTPCVLSHHLWAAGLDEGETHWFLRKGRRVLDPTAGQFEGVAIPYHIGRGSGFLTRQPSRRARILITRVLEMNRGRPPVFDEHQALAVADLVRKYKVNGTRDILRSPSGPLATLRPACFKEPLLVSEPTIAEAARKHGVELKQGRPKKVA